MLKIKDATDIQQTYYTPPVGHVIGSSRLHDYLVEHPA